jgi:hypothetical protein
MNSKKAPSRLEVNRDIRRIFSRHHVDLTNMNFSCHGKSVTLTGALRKDGGRDFSASEVDCIAQEIYRMSISILCELNNWDITPSGITKKGGSDEKKAEHRPSEVKAGGAKP